MPESRSSEPPNPRTFEPPPAAITFDCAQTLVKVDWQPAVLAVKSAKRAGIDFDTVPAAEIYERKLRTRWPEFMELNKRRDEKVLATFWRELTNDWLEEAGMPVEKTDDVVKHANNLLFGEGSEVFQLYDDVLPCLKALREGGFRMAVISNWDNSLHRTLRMFGLAEYFEHVVASMEEGVEKPDPRLFHITLDRLGVEPDKDIHVGDNPLDDWQGAKSAGMRALIIDRDNPEPSHVRITSLAQLPEAVGL